jgi:CheY-like chemotaxis protein
MAKPVIASELLDEVLRQLGRYAVINPVQPPPATTSTQVIPRRVLLVEDSKVNRRVALGLLNARGHQVVMVENGLEAVQAVAAQEFDVVLMDMQMPVMDGYAATAEIRKREQQTGGHIPIVAMTAEALQGDRERCLAAGMDDYVPKPIARAEMYRAVERFPALCLSADVGLQRVSELSKATENLVSPAIAASIIARHSSGGVTPAFDHGAAMNNVGGDADLLRELIGAGNAQGS